ncbi:PfkB family carbohydrate kinase [Streptomyces sp. NPDC087263]|uniref:PfkB family carbohydrate kinase n=1 Tax=Streptomyces sp. NPDC087263 TaxID=3365773 RepID=UPI003810D836
MSQRLVAVFSHAVTDEVYTADGTLSAREVGGAGAYAAVGAGLVSAPWSTAIVSGVGALDRRRLGAWFRRREIDPVGLFEVGEHSPVTRVRYRGDGERVEESVLGDAHFAAHTPFPSRWPVGQDRLAGAYLFHGTDERYWSEVAALRPRWRGPVLWEIAADACTPADRARVTELAGLVDVLSLNAAEAAALTGRPDPLDALARLPGNGLVVVLRCGAAGSLVRHGRRTWQVGTAPGPVIDPTGGGNAYSGAFLAAYASTGDIPASARAAAAAASRTIAQYGAPGVGPLERDETRRAVREVTVSATTT